MELKKAIEKAKKLVEDNYMADSENEAVATILKALEQLQEDNAKLKTKNRTQKQLTERVREVTTEQVVSTIEEFEKDYISKDKIKEKIEETRSKMHEFESDNAHRLYLEHFNQNYFNKQSKRYGVFNTQEVITHCRLQEYVIKIGALQELLKGE